MSHAMLDLETLDTDNQTSVILSIGLVQFDEESLITKLHIRLSVPAQLKLGRTISDDTMSFWLRQTEAAKELADMSVRLPMVAVRLVDDFIEDNEISYIWGNDTMFDVGNLQSLFKQVKDTWPLEFWAPRCYRTLLAMNPPDEKPPMDKPHSALADAEYQAKRLQGLCRKYGLSLEELQGG